MSTPENLICLGKVLCHLVEAQEGLEKILGYPFDIHDLVKEYITCQQKIAPFIRRTGMLISLQKILLDRQNIMQSYMEEASILLKEHEDRLNSNSAEECPQMYLHMDEVRDKIEFTRKEICDIKIAIENQKNLETGYQQIQSLIDSLKNNNGEILSVPTAVATVRAVETPVVNKDCISDKADSISASSVAVNNVQLMHPSVNVVENEASLALAAIQQEEPGTINPNMAARNPTSSSTVEEDDELVVVNATTS
jgi:hypothetical protein